MQRCKQPFARPEAEVAPCSRASRIFRTPNVLICERAIYAFERRQPRSWPQPKHLRLLHVGYHL